MPNEPPFATEETNHIWVRTGSRTVNLTAEVAKLIALGRSGCQPDMVTAQTILSHPMIEEAVSQWLASQDQDEVEMR